MLNWIVLSCNKGLRSFVDVEKRSTTDQIKFIFEIWSDISMREIYYFQFWLINKGRRYYWFSIVGQDKTFITTSYFMFHISFFDDTLDLDSIEKCNIGRFFLL